MCKDALKISLVFGFSFENGHASSLHSNLKRNEGKTVYAVLCE